MTAIHYHYTFRGKGACGECWETSGTISVEGQGKFLEAVQEALRQTFLQLTGGQAIFGEPGKGTCKGPYQIEHFSIDEATVQ